VKRVAMLISFWTPFVFAGLICFMTSMMAHEAPGPVFYASLPLAFMFVAFAFGRLYAEVRKLEAKVGSLEAGVNQKTIKNGAA